MVCVIVIMAIIDVLIVIIIIITLLQNQYSDISVGFFLHFFVVIISSRTYLGDSTFIVSLSYLHIFLNSLFNKRKWKREGKRKRLSEVTERRRIKEIEA